MIFWWAVRPSIKWWVRNVYQFHGISPLFVTSSTTKLSYVNWKLFWEIMNYRKVSNNNNNKAKNELWCSSLFLLFEKEKDLNNKKFFFLASSSILFLLSKDYKKSFSLLSLPFKDLYKIYYYYKLIPTLFVIQL